MSRVIHRRLGELLGGPADGAEIYLPAVQRRYHVPLVAPDAVNTCGHDLAVLGTVAVYELEREPAGEPVITRGGRLAYRYTGTR